jgi:hypothetical protein
MAAAELAVALVLLIGWIIGYRSYLTPARQYRRRLRREDRRNAALIAERTRR